VYGTFLGSAAQTALATNYSNVATDLQLMPAQCLPSAAMQYLRVPVTVVPTKLPISERRLAVRAASSPRLHRTARASFGPHCWAASREGRTIRSSTGWRWREMQCLRHRTVQGGDYPQVNAVHPIGGAGGAVISGARPSGCPAPLLDLRE